MRYIIALLLLSGCGSTLETTGGYKAPQTIPHDTSPTVNTNDVVAVRGRIEISVSTEKESSMARLFKSLFLTNAYAATGATTVTYVNTGVLAFTLNTTNLATSPSFTGDILNLGDIVLSNINDNTLKVCGVGGTTKCTQAIIRAYTITAPVDAFPSTGTTQGFANVSDAGDIYGVPVYVGSLNPSTAIPYNSSGAVQTQVIAIAGNKNRLKLADFGTLSARTYSVSADFSNAGTGQYKMRLVIEYILQ